MVLLTLQNIGKSFGIERILTDVNLTVMEGQRVGLVGVNGCGKSTLLKIIGGELAPDEGSVSVARGTSVGFLSQEADISSDLTVFEELARVFEPVRKMEEKLRALEGEMAEKHDDEDAFRALSNAYAQLTDRFEAAGGYEWQSRIQGVLAGLGFASGREHMSARLLSGGEKTRLCLARVLLMKPDLLLLDEPTNHLDLRAMQWLEDTLKKYKGTVIVISHDRFFMNAVCDGMAEIHMTRLSQYSGNYDEFVKKRDADLERQVKSYQLQQAEIARQEAIIARYRMYNKEKSIKHAESREKLLEKMERIDRPVEDKRVRFSFDARRRPGDDVLMMEGLKKSFDGRVLFENFSLHLRAGDRALLIGPNGVGKTTLLKIIMEKLRPDEGHVRFGANVDAGYYEQQQESLSPEKTIMEDVWDDFPYLEPGQVRNVLALFLFTGEDVFQRIGTLSGGERGRVALAKLMLKRDNLLLLDEPTNHLDMNSREVLERALEKYTGTILAVSHDRYFINRIANRVIEMSQNGVEEYLGNYDDYLIKKDKLAAGAEDVEGGMTRTEREKIKRKQRLLKETKEALKVRVKSLEEQIGALESRLQTLDEQMGRPEIFKDPEAAASVARERRESAEALDALLAEWDEAAEAAEQAQ